MKALVGVRDYFDTIISTRDEVHGGLSKTWHKDSRKHLDGVPFAVKQARAELDKRWRATASYFDQKAYTDINSPELSGLWAQFIADPEKESNKQQHYFVTEYKNVNRSDELKSWTIANLNLPNVSSKDFKIETESEWEDVYSLAYGQLVSEFNGGFTDWIKKQVGATDWR